MAIHFKTAVGYIRRSPFQATAAIFVLSLTFFVATLVGIMVYSSSNLITYFETRPQIIAFLKGDATADQIADLQHELAGDTRVKEVKYVSKEEALTIYKEATSDNPLLGELVSPSIFPASLEFSISNLDFAQSVIDDIKKEAIVESVGFTAALGGESSLNDVLGRLKTLTSYIKIGGAVFVGMLSLTSFVVLLVIISMRMVVRREEVEILKLLGATRGFIRSPIMIEALIYSVLGVLLGWIVAFTMVLYLAPTAVTYFGDIPVLPKETISIIQVFGVILGIELLAGIVLALGGTSFALSRVRKMR